MKINIILRIVFALVLAPLTTFASHFDLTEESEFVSVFTNRSTQARIQEIKIARNPFAKRQLSLDVVLGGLQPEESSLSLVEALKDAKIRSQISKIARNTVRLKPILSANVISYVGALLCIKRFENINPSFNEITLALAKKSSLNEIAESPQKIPAPITALPLEISVSEAMNPEHDEVIHASTIFKREKAIRIIVTNGGGIGNQRAGLTAMIRLHQLGFQGTYHVLCSPGSLKRFTQLLAGYNKFDLAFPDERVIVEVDDMESNSALEKISLGIVAADDTSLLYGHAKWRVENLIHVQPTDWFGLRGVTLNDVNTTLSESLVLWDHISYKGRELDVIKTTLGEDPRREFLLSLVLAMLDDKIDIQIVYGLDDWKTKALNGIFREGSPSYIGLNQHEELSLLAKGYQKIQAALTKPVVVLVVSDVHPSNFRNIKVSDRFKLVPKATMINDVDVSGAQPGDVTFINFGALDQPVFDMLLECTSIPPVIEGANARTTAKCTRGSFCLGGRSFILADPAHMRVADEFPRQHELFLRMTEALSYRVNLLDDIDVEKRADTIGEFIIACMNHSMDDYFSTWKKYFLDRPDAVITAAMFLH